VDIYYKSVGRGACLNLNLPPDRRGQIHPNDVQSLRGMRQILESTFATNLAAGANILATNIRGKLAKFSPSHLLDGNRTTYWATDDGVVAPELVFELGSARTFNVVELREYLPLGQRIDEFRLEQWKDGGWVEFARGTSIGNRRLVRQGPITTEKVRLRLRGPVGPALAEFGLYAEPSASAPK
jgi:alpha-L-fucosidase